VNRTAKRRDDGAAVSIRYVLLAMTLVAGFGARGAVAFEIVVPAYFYPSANSGWNAMTAAADDVDITAIMNPFNGPGGSLDANYVAAVNAFRAAGGRVIGYVYSSYGSRPLAQVTADIDKYVAWYDIDGIFVDEMANTGPAERLNYYKAIYNHVKGIDAQWEVMGNPGTHTIEEYLTWPAADRLMVFENVGAQYPDYAPSAWNLNHDRARFVHLVHTEPSSANMSADVVLAAARNAGAIYVTGDVLNNPWDTLPTYWQAHVDAVAQLHGSFLSSDFNEDGQVDGDDLAAWRAGYGQFDSRARRQHGDATGDDNVDGADFIQWQRQGGQTSATATSSAPGNNAITPEPTSVLIAAAGGLAWIAAVRSSRR
jgi:hypothetical protein